MLQIIDLENNELFSEISHEESATVSGGGPVSYAFGSFIALSAGIFNNPQNPNLSRIVQTALFALAINPWIP
ncbi:MAG: hypothetical protein KAF91_16645 [Nostoc sp. TH1S01]|nr:hypothetical protein [Nostoc sp. TH1S01]